MPARKCFAASESEAIRRSLRRCIAISSRNLTWRGLLLKQSILDTLARWFADETAQRVPREFVDAWQGHAPKQKSASDHYVHVTDADSQGLMAELEFPEMGDAES